MLRLIAGGRSPESHVAGGVAINCTPDSPRYSQDVDIFHDALELTLKSAEQDVQLLAANGFDIVWAIKQPGFCRVVVSKENVNKERDSVKLEWVFDSAYRFFPAMPDVDLGYRLHLADVAVNKVLAAASRREPRDFVDLIYLHTTYLHIAALIWAAPGKDPGFSPESLLEHLDRNKAISPIEFEQLQLTRPIDPIAVRKQWEKMKEETTTLISQYPVETVGCLFLQKRDNKPCLPDLDKFENYTHHFGSLRGAWPQLA